MTYKDVFIRILSEVSGKSEKEVSDLLTTFRKTHPGGKWDKELSREESEKLLEELRAEGPGILNWLVQGAARVTGSESGTVH